MTEKIRKAVVTTAEVQEALSEYLRVRAELSGTEQSEALEFDKGARGKGFATYDSSGTAVKTWETKEEAREFYATWTRVASEVLSAIADRARRETEEKKAQPRKVAAKVVEGSQEGDKAAA